LGQVDSLPPEAPSADKKENGHAIAAELIPNPAEIPKNGGKLVVKPSTKTTIKLNDLLKGKKTSEEVEVLESRPVLNEPFTPEQLHLVWNDFAVQRKKFQAEYQLLIQPFEIRANLITIHLLSTVQETMLNNFKSDLITYLRENLKNNSIMVVGELKETEEKQMLYTPRDKFEYLLEKNPLLKMMRDRLGLDPDF
jgi:DNA polymerase-3 subunit gamma/tau